MAMPLSDDPGKALRQWAAFPGTFVVPIPQSRARGIQPRMQPTRSAA